ncbi:hypothetical protein Tco_0251425 [Tanacetum coccineum]
MTESPLMDSGFVVPVFSPGDDPIACLNKAMAFLMTVASSRFPSTNNQLRTSSNPRNQATIQDGRVTVQQVQGRQCQSYSSTRYKSNATSLGGNNASRQARVVKYYNYQGEGHMARQCTQPKRPRNASWYKEKAMLARAQEAGQILDEEQLAFLADLGVPDGQAVQTIIPNNVAFQTKDLDTYDSDCDDISNAQAALMDNISNYGSDVISEVPHSKTYLNDIENQSVHAMQDFEQTPAVDFSHNEIHSDSNIISYSQYLEETQQANVQDTHLQAQQDSMILSVIKQMSEQMINHMDDMIRKKLALKEQVDSLEKNLSKQIKEKKCLLQTFTVFKSESKEKEDKYMENEIDLEKKIKELDNIIFKVGQSAQTVHKTKSYGNVNVYEDLEEEPAPTTGETSAPPAPKTTKQLAARRNQKRVKSILLLAIPDEYIPQVSHVAVIAKSPTGRPIKSRFGGNVESKKMQKNVPKKHQSGRNQGRRSYGDNGRSNAPTNESSSQALVAQDGLGGYELEQLISEVEPSTML